MADKETVRAFNADVGVHDGYVYTSSDQLSCRLAVKRWADTILELTSMGGRTVLDVGCGDGYFDRLFWDAARPSAMTAIDPAAEAVKAAQAKRGERPIEYAVGDGHRLAFPDGSFDVVLVQGVLHHDDDAAAIVREACRVGREVVILEPNGYNAVLKLLEKLSPYHRSHKEKSYPPGRIDGWFRDSGFRVEKRLYRNLVPVFSPDWAARTLKFFEPVVETLPVLNMLGCATYAIRAVVDR